MNDRMLALEDIADARAYEREREEFRARIIALKKKRRVSVGPVLTLVFENRDTIRFQIQEMARAERLLSDQAIQVELDTYNPLIPGPGQLSASLYIELTSRAEMDYWLPRLVSIEQSVRFEVAPVNGSGPLLLPCLVEEAHAANLTRAEVTAAVHFVRWELSGPEVERFRTGNVTLAVDHPAYQERSVLSDDTRDALLEDLLG